MATTMKDDAVKASALTAKTIHAISEWAEITVHFPNGGHCKAEGRVRFSAGVDGKEGCVWIGNVCLKETTPVVDYGKNDEYGVFYL